MSDCASLLIMTFLNYLKINQSTGHLYIGENVNRHVALIVEIARNQQDDGHMLLHVKHISVCCLDSRSISEFCIIHCARNE